MTKKNGWFAVEANPLRKALALARMVKSHNSHPILNFTLVQTTQDFLVLTVTDLSTTLVLKLAAQIETPDTALALPTLALSDWLATQPPNERVTTTLNLETAMTTLQVGRASARLRGIAAEEFPGLPPTPDGVSLELDGEELINSIRRVVFASAKKDLRPTLEGVNMRIGDKALTLVAADGFQLAAEHLTIQDTVLDAPKHGIVPADALELVAKLIQLEQQTMSIEMDDTDVRPLVSMTLSETHIQFRVGRHTVVSTLIEGEYPRFDQVAGLEHPIQATLDPTHVVEALKATAPFSTEGIALTFAPDGLTMAGAEAQTGDLTVHIPLSATRELATPLSVRIQSRFLRQVCAAIGSANELTIGLKATTPTESHEPVVLGLPSVPGWKYVVMPLVS